MWYVYVRSLITHNGWNAVDEVWSKEQAQSVALDILNTGVDVVAIEGPNGEWFEYTNTYGQLVEVGRS